MVVKNSEGRKTLPGELRAIYALFIVLVISVITLSFSDRRKHPGNPGNPGNTFSVNTPPPPNLVAEYGFNENAGTTLADNSGNNLNGTLVNGPAWTASGKYGAALSFDGTNDL